MGIITRGAKLFGTQISGVDFDMTLLLVANGYLLFELAV